MRASPAGATSRPTPWPSSRRASARSASATATVETAKPAGPRSPPSEYTEERAPRIRTTAGRDGSRWTIAVSDEGIGMDPDETDRIFDVFDRLHSRADHDGTGIGLAICQRIVERHGGDIRVDSTPGEGSTFCFTLPTTDGTHD